MISIENFKIELQRLLNNYKVAFLISIIIFLDLLFYNAIPWLAGMVFNVNNYANFNSILNSFILLNFHHIATSLIPMPGLSDVIFFSLFFNFYNNNYVLIGLAQIFWRFFAFYFDLFIGGFVSLFYNVQTEDKPIEISRKTFITMQFETFEERKNTVIKTNNNLQKELQYFVKKEDKNIKKDYGLNNVDLDENMIFKDSFQDNDNADKKKSKKERWHNIEV